jgi:hypothetical protein
VTFDQTHYVPVLKLKAGEKEALPLLSSTVRQRITPLLEVVERDKEKKATPGEHIDTAFKKFKPAVEELARYFLDCREVASDGPETAQEVFRRAADVGTPFVPVTGITRSVDIQAALAYRASGLALRLTREEYECGSVRSDLLSFIKAHNVAPEFIDLIIDLGAVDDMVLPGVHALAAAFLNEIPDPTSWRTLTMSASAFPPGMAGLESRSYDLIDRLDWLAWRDCIRANASFPRLPTFSDGVIQHPSGVEGVDWRTINIPASVRYTTGDQWLRIKGVGTRTEPPSDQLQRLATSLVYGHLSGHFRGASHCEGCGGMWSAAQGADNFGSLTVWRRLGTVHHITDVIEQLGALGAP